MPLDTALNALSFSCNKTYRNLEDTENQIRNDPNLKPRLKVELCSAMNTFRRIVGRPARDIAEDIIVIRELMAKANFVGISFSTWTNTKSKVLRCLRLCGVLLMSGRCKTPCSPGWDTILKRIPGMPHRTQLTRLTRFCCDHKIDPTGVNQETGDAFHAAMQAQYAKTRYQKVYLACIHMWNLCVAEFPDFWPQSLIEPRYERDDYSYPKERFRESFRTQAAAIVAAAFKPPLGRMAGRPGVKKSTAEKRFYTLYRLASIRARLLNVDPSEIQSVNELVDPPKNLNLVLDYIARRVSGRPDDELEFVKTGDLHNICRVMHTIAKYDLGLAPEKLAVIAKMRAHVAPAEGAAESTIELFEKLRRPEVQESFLLLPDVIVEELRRKKRKTKVDAIIVQTAVIWAIEVCAPMRGDNSVRLRDGESLLWHGSGRNRICRVFVSGDKTKNERPLRFILRPDVVRLIDIYRREFLPLLGYADQGYLCPGKKNATKAAAQLSNQLAKLSGERLGIRMTAHKWRHAVGYIYLLHNPGKYEPVRRMLGHSSVKVTETYYAFMLGEDAQAEIDKTFNDIRERGRQRLRRNQTARGTRYA